MKHGWNTEMKIRVPSVFHPWPQLPPTFFRVFRVFRGFSRISDLSPRVACGALIGPGDAEFLHLVL
jgi:hypothetical protein